MSTGPSSGRRSQRRRLGIAAAAIAASALALSACAPAESDEVDEASTTLVVGIAGDPATLDPGTASEPIANTIIKNTYFQWTRYGVGEETADGYAISDVSQILPEAISYELSDDGLVATFTITDGSVFVGGDPVTSDDFIFTVERALETDLGPVFIFNTAGITDISQIERISDTEFTVTLPAPSPMLGPLLRDQDASVLDSAVVGENATDDDPWALDWMAQNNIGNGAYLLDSYEPGNQAVLTKNPDYPWVDEVSFDTVILQIIPSETDRAQLLANGTLDVAIGLGADAIQGLEGTDGVSVNNIPARSQDYIGLVQTFEPFADVRVRQALAHAIPYDSIANDLGKGYTAVPAGLWPQNSASFDPDLDNSPTVEDIELARTLLTDAGYADGFEFTLDVSTADPKGQELAVAVQSALNEIGVTMSINQLAPAAFSEKSFSDEGHAFMVTGSSAYVDDPYYTAFLFYTSDAVLNRYAYSNAAVDEITAALSTELDPEVRQELASELQFELNADVPVLVLGEPDHLLAMADDVTGFVLEPDGLTRFATMSRR